MGLAGLIIGYAVASGINGGLIVNPGTVPTPPAAGDNTVPTPPPTNDTPATVDDDPVLGKASATITLIECTDFQCPFCSRHFTQTFPQIKKDYIDTGKVKYVSRDFPLSFHPNAQKASEAAECAKEQNKYWEMHDKLFIAQEEWSNLAAADAAKKFKEYAASLGLPAASYASCLDTGKTAAEVKKDLADGSASGIDGTPGFWILGPDGKNQKISGAYPFDTFKKAFDDLLGS